MPLKDPTPEQIAGWANTRSPAGFVWPARGTQPHYDQLMRMLYWLAQSGASACLVAPSSLPGGVVEVLPGRARIDTTGRVWPGGPVGPLANNTVSHVWAQAGSAPDGLAVGHGPSGAGWPDIPHVRLARVTVSAGQVTQILDLRGESWLRS